MNSEGELKKRIHSILEESYKADKIKLGTATAIMNTIEDAKKDLIPEKYWITWAKMKHKDDDQLEKDYKYSILKLVKWFGESE